MQISLKFSINFKRLRKSEEFDRVDQSQEKILYGHDFGMENFKRMDKQGAREGSFFNRLKPDPADAMEVSQI
jgi:hypothetical protein